MRYDGHAARNHNITPVARNRRKMGQLPDALNRKAHVTRIQSAGTTARVTGMTPGQAAMAAGRKQEAT